LSSLSSSSPSIDYAVIPGTESIITLVSIWGSRLQPTRAFFRLIELEEEEGEVKKESSALPA
ncbi:unnamed protein product, partial [Arabidopsis halleri]